MSFQWNTVHGNFSVQQLQLVINLKTANALGLTVLAA
jgi:hypothetical protein